MTVYIDGFNWYWGIFAHRPALKWLNLQSFFEALRNGETVTRIYFCTALTDEYQEEGKSQIRQLAYLKALETLPKVKVVMGGYQIRRRKCKAECGKVFHVPEEKQTDVNLVVSMFADVIAGETDHLCIVSADTDIHPAMRWIVANYPALSVTNYIPVLEKARKFRRIDGLRGIGSVRFLPLDEIARHILPNPVVHPSGEKIFCPDSWV